MEYDTVSSTDESLEMAVLSKQVSELYAALKSAIYVSILNAIIVTIVLWSTVGHLQLISWLSAILILSLIREFILHSYNSTQKIDSEKYYTWFFISSIFSSFIWGGSAFWIFPVDDLAYQVFLAFVVGGMASGAVTTLSYSKKVVNVFIAISMAPLIIRFYLEDVELGLEMATMLIIYMVALIQLAKKSYDQNTQNIYTHIDNINKQRSLDESDYRYKKLLETATDAFFLHDLNGNILDVNNEACRSLGYSSDELLHLTVADIDADTSKPKVNWDELKEGNNVRFDSVHQRKDGTTFPVEVSLGYIYMNNNPLVSVLARDITERKRIDKMKNEFISTVSHELRTPLTSIKGGLGLLNGGALGEMPEQAKGIISIASHNADSLLLLVNDILDMQKIETGELDMTFGKLDLMPFLTEVVEDNKSYADQFNVTFALQPYDETVFISANKDRLRQVMANLLSNAAKFSNEHGSVEVVVSQPDEKIIRVSVIDHGMGIAEDFYPIIFNKFTQQDSSDTRQKGGTGLGLSISKAIIEKHHGEIAFTSKQGEGTTFYFDLPVLAAE